MLLQLSPGKGAGCMDCHVVGLQICNTDSVPYRTALSFPASGRVYYTYTAQYLSLT